MIKVLKDLMRAAATSGLEGYIGRTKYMLVSRRNCLGALVRDQLEFGKANFLKHFGIIVSSRN